LHVPIRVARTPYAYGTSASVVLSRMASSATLAWNSGKWVCRFFSSDHFFRQATHLNDWSEITLKPLKNGTRLKYDQA
ncbi:MAG: hypothetical protein P8Q92_18460, partial [Pseudoprimorskyibacter sp.]|nr:hypothetical protein [Pseudoprimorskyibacter sp.]